MKKPPTEAAVSIQLFGRVTKRVVTRSLFMDHAFETTEAQQTLEAFAGICRIRPDEIMFIFRIE